MGNSKNWLSGQKPKSNEELLKCLYASAKQYNAVASKNVLFICASGKQNPRYSIYEVYFGKENFIHLVGFQTKKAKFIKEHGENVEIPGEILNTPNALEFFENCVNGSVNLGDYSFKESRKASSEKLDVFPKLLDYRYVKLYKKGNHDKATINNKFEACIGNDNGVLGFDKRNRKAALPVPVTVIKREISYYCTCYDKVIAVLTKSKPDMVTYDTVEGSVKTPVLVESLPKYIQKKIDASIKNITYK